MATSSDLLAPLSPVIYTLGPADIQEVTRVGNSAFFLMGYSAAFWLELLSHRSSVVAFGCRDGGTDSLVGFLVVSKDARVVIPAEERVGPLHALLRHRKCAYVRTMAVLRSYRRLGVASMLLEAASAALRAMRNPPTLLLCRVPAHNGEAVACLERNGFTVYTEMPGLVCGADRLFTHMIY